MEIKFDLTEEELKDIAKKNGKTIEEVANDYKYALNDLEYSLKKIDSIIDTYQYKKFPDNIYIGNYGKKSEFNSKYLCHDKMDEIMGISLKDLAIVTGFGPTNAPTAGTLASIFKVLELQKETGIYTHIIISDLSALNSRQKPLDDLFHYTHQFINFIKKLGFDESNGEIRTHNFLDHSRTFSVMSSVLSVKDFSDGEATDELYKRLNLLGNDFSTMISMAYTTADIVLPIIRDKKKGVIVTAGLEEHLYPYLARVSIERMKKKSGGLNNLVDKDAKVGALYGKLIGGLFPYVKMSKSIKESSINLEDSDEELYNKIVKCSQRNESIILQMIVLASNWKYAEIENAIKAFENREFDAKLWLNYKKQYYEFFIKIKKIWDDSKYNKIINTYDNLFEVK